jgi:cupin fold WbuC family metalloprotein
MKITKALLDSLTEKAKVSPRLRMNFDLRNTPADTSQRMLNAIEPGCILPIHRHRHSSETVVCLRGHLREVFYNDKGEVTEMIDLLPGSECVALNVPIGQWHTVEVLESGTVILEVKDEAYSPLSPEDILSTVG